MSDKKSSKKKPVKIDLGRTIAKPPKSLKPKNKQDKKK